MPVSFVFESIDKIHPEEESYVSSIHIKMKAEELSDEVGRRGKYLPALKGESFDLGDNYYADIQDVIVVKGYESNSELSIHISRYYRKSIPFEPDIIKTKYKILIEKIVQFLDEIAKADFLDKKLKIVRGEL